MDLEVREVVGDAEALVADPKRADVDDELILVVARENFRVLQRLLLVVLELQGAESPLRLEVGGPPCARFQVGHELRLDLLRTELRAQVGLRVLRDDLQNFAFDRGHEPGDFGRGREAERGR